jgi:alanine racemase
LCQLPAPKTHHLDGFTAILPMPRPLIATIHPHALHHNLVQTRKHAPDAKAWAVIKANAYGHGIERVLPALQGADGVALLDLDEAVRTRQWGWRGPILLLEGVFDPRDLEACSRLGLWHVVHCQEQLDMLAMHKTQTPHRVFLKMNSGMNRLGFAPDAFRAAWMRLNTLPQVDDISLMTHFSDADGLRQGLDGIAQQLHTFEQATADLPGERSYCNSAATLRHAQRRIDRGLDENDTLASDWVRLGVALYGASPDYPEHTAHDWQLQPAMSLRSQLVAVQTLQAGDTVGYGSSFVAPQAMRIGVVACGYADGYPRHAHQAPVLVQGIRTQQIGRVSMDLLTIDLRPIDAHCQAHGLPLAGWGSEALLWGQSALHGAALPIDEVAHAASTIGYELMCALAPRVPVQVDDDATDAKAHPSHD